MARNAYQTDIETVRDQWTDSMIRRRIYLDYLWIDDQSWKLSRGWIEDAEVRISDLQHVLAERGVPSYDGPVFPTMLDKMLDAISIFRDGVA